MALVTLLSPIVFCGLGRRLSALVNWSRFTGKLALMDIRMAKGAPLLRIILGLSAIGVAAITWLTGVPATQIKAGNTMVKPRLIPPDW